MTASRIVAPSKIQSELNTLWSSLENKNKMRASLFNLIFYTKKSPRDEYIRKIAQKIIEKFPARIFFISSDVTNNTSQVKTAVSIMSAEQGEYDVTCDFIEISTTANTENQVPFILLPHLIPDLPVFLVWAEDPMIESPLRSQLEKFATRCIFDSETAQDLTGFAKAILQIKEKSNCEIADLNWARLESWRDLLAAVFNESSLFAKLKKIHNLKICYNAQETPFFCHTKIQSIYLQAWLSCRLGWTLQSSALKEDSLSLIYLNQAQEKVAVHIDSDRQAKLPPGLIITLTLSGSEQEEFKFERNVTAPNQISCTYNTKTPCSVPTKFLIAKGESGQSLVKEICHKGTSNHYLEIVTLLSKMEPFSLC
jgi:glucose-6-phosphate dehydrogenase assembly protein OpcA